MTKPLPAEVRCEACHGRGSPPVQEVAPGRRLYPAPCRKCHGKGRVTRLSQRANPDRNAASVANTS
jgi:DnaJ-class molecular chaperone